MGRVLRLTVFGWMMFRAGSGAPGEFERMAGNFINLPAIVDTRSTFWHCGNW